jgi:hypothetical protein
MTVAKEWAVGARCGEEARGRSEEVKMREGKK